MKILIIDNYDSFTYNLYYYLLELNVKPLVIKNDFNFDFNFLDSFDAFIISPGFGSPLDSGISMDVIKEFAPRKKILGVCLGHQCIASAFGGKVEKMKKPLHAKNALCYFLPNELCKGIKNPFKVALYHSLFVSDLGDCDCLGYANIDNEKIPMILKHKSYRTYGVQFHPESILQNNGKILLSNFLSI